MPHATGGDPSDADAGPRRGFGRNARKIAWCVCLPVIGLMGIEFVVASLNIAPIARSPIALWDAKRDQSMKAGDFQFQANRRWLWELRPDFDRSGEAINRDGYRGTWYPKERSERTLRIAVLGESSVFGFGVPEEETWPRRLEKSLRVAGQQAEVLNFGVTGHTLAQGHRLYVGRVRDYRPDLVIASFGNVNEQLRNRDGLSDLHRLDLVNGRLSRLAQFIDRYAAGRVLLALCASEDPRLKSSLDKSTRSKRVPPAEFSTILRTLKAEVDADGARLLLVSPARRPETEVTHPDCLTYNELIQEFAVTEKVVLIDAHQEARQYCESEARALGVDVLELRNRSSFFLDGWHPSEKGHAAIAELAMSAVRIKDVAVVSDRPRVDTSGALPANSRR